MRLRSAFVNGSARIKRESAHPATPTKIEFRTVKEVVSQRKTCDRGVVRMSAKAVSEKV